MEQYRGTTREQEQLVQTLRADLTAASNARDAIRKECQDTIPPMRRRLDELSQVAQSLPAKDLHIQRLEAQVSSLTHQERESTLKDGTIEQLRAENRALDVDVGALKARCEALDPLKAERVGELEVALKAVTTRLESETKARASAEAFDKRHRAVEKELRDQLVAVEAKYAECIVAHYTFIYCADALAASIGCKGPTRAAR